MTTDKPEVGPFADDGSQRGGVEPRVKGIAIKGAVDALNVSRELALELLPERLKHYLDETLLVSGWYPEEDHYGLLLVIAKIYYREGKDVWFWIGRRAARHDLTRLYQAMVQIGRPFNTMRRFPKIWRLYRTAGYLKVQTIGSTKGVVRLYDYPFMTPDTSRLMAGYLAETIQLSGGVNVLVNPTARGHSVGAPTIWTVSWSEESGED